MHSTDGDDGLITCEHDDRTTAWCSWCLAQTAHELTRHKRVGQSIYICEGCGQPTARCMTVRCTNMTRSTGKSTDAFCAVHNGKIGSFEGLGASITDPVEFVDVVGRKEGYNWDAITKVACTGVGGAVLLAPAAVFAAPAVGGAIGSMMGLSGAAATSAGLALLGGGSLASGGFGMVGGTCVLSALGGMAGTVSGGLLANNYLADMQDFSIEKIRVGSEPSLLFIDGFLTKGSDASAHWLDNLPERYSGNAAYYVHWDSKNLRELGDLIASGGVRLALQKLATKAAKQATREAPVKLMPLAIAAGVLGVANNPWSLALVRSEQAGELLKEMIVRCEGRSFVLFGHSLGARVIYRALSSLGTVPKPQRRSRVLAAHLLGGAVGNKPSDAWTLATKAVDRNLHAYQSANDSVLKWLYQVGVLLGHAAIGVEPIAGNHQTKQKLRNHDVSRQVSGHSAYHDTLASILVS